MRGAAKTLLSLFAALATSCLAACASEPGYQTVGRGGFGHGGGGDSAQDGGLPNTFISPAGKPYRAKDGDPYPVALWFAEADTDHDGKLSLDEFRRDATAFFNELDANHDGLIDGFEAQQYEQKIAPEILPRIEGLGAGEGMDLALGRGSRGRGGPEIGAVRGGGGPDTAGDRRAQGAGLFGFLNEPEPVSASDADFNGKITLSEFLAAADRRFAVLNAKGTGTLTLASLPKTPIQNALEQLAKRRAAHPPSERRP